MNSAFRIRVIPLLIGLAIAFSIWLVVFKKPDQMASFSTDAHEVAKSQRPPDKQILEPSDANPHIDGYSVDVKEEITEFLVNLNSLPIGRSSLSQFNALVSSFARKHPLAFIQHLPYFRENLTLAQFESVSSIAGHCLGDLALKKNDTEMARLVNSCFDLVVQGQESHYQGFFYSLGSSWAARCKNIFDVMATNNSPVYSSFVSGALRNETFPSSAVRLQSFVDLAQKEESASSGLLERLCSVGGQHNPILLLDVLSNCSNLNFRDEASAKTFGYWCDYNLNEALTWLATQPSSSLKDRLIVASLGQIWQNDDVALEKWLSSIADEELRRKYAKVYSKNLSNSP